MFIPGKQYRRSDLHAEFGGQRQGGISTPANHPLIFLFTGESGEQYGYKDGPHEDGAFWYTGEGQLGDMQMRAGNMAIRDHERHGKTLHLFEILTGRHRTFVQHISEARYLDHHTEEAPDRDGNRRRALVFRLELLTSSTGAVPVDVHQLSRSPLPELWDISMEELRGRALQASRRSSAAAERRQIVRERSEAVRIYVLRRAKGICEGCSNPGPFVTQAGHRFLETHHIRRRADGGPDHPRWVAALCPNCHRRVHHGTDGPEYNAAIAKRLEKTEPEFSGVPLK